MASRRIQTKRTGSRPARKRVKSPRLLTAPRSGDRCPRCGQGFLDYNGMLDLACAKCGYIAGGAGGGCT